MEGREAMPIPGPGAHPPPFYFPRGAFTSIPASQSASALHAPPGFRPMPNPSFQQLPFPFGEQRHHQDFSHGIHMGMASSPPTMQSSVPPPGVKKKRGRPRKYLPDNKIDLGLSPMSSSHKPNNSSSMSDPDAPKRARGRPPGTGRKQRLANLGEWMNTSAGLAFAPHVISVEAGEDIVSKVLSFSHQRPRALCIMSGTGTVSTVTLRQTGSSVPTLTFQGHFEILSLGGSYLVTEESGPKSRTGGISVSLSRPDGYLIGGGVGTLIAASLVQVVACSFVYGSGAKAKSYDGYTARRGGLSRGTPERGGSPSGIRSPTQSPGLSYIPKSHGVEKGSKEDNKSSKMETPTSPPPPLTATVSEAEPPQTSPLDFSAPGCSGSGGGNNRSIDSRNHNHLTDIDLTRG